MIKGIKFPLEKAIFRLDLTPKDCRCIVGVTQISTAEQELQKRTRSTLEKYRIIDRRAQHTAESNAPPNFIQIIGYEGLENLFVRYIPLDLKSKYFEYGKDPRRPERDVIDVLFSTIDFPDGWTYVDQGGKIVHIFDRIDEYVRTLFFRET